MKASWICGVAAVVAVLAGSAAGCRGGGPVAAAPGDQIPVGHSSQSLLVGGISRTFHLYRPAGIGGPAPLVVMLHGGFGDARQAERAYHWDTEADAEHFIVAYPDGVDRAWNAGTCCGKPMHANVDDTGFLTGMVSTIQTQMPIDPARIYATGMSNGAIMALRLGCQSNTFAAIAPVAGTLLTDCSHAQPVSVIQIHGTADDRVPYDGGEGSGTAHVDGPAVPAVNATWRDIDSCTPPTSTTDGTVTTQTAPCPQNRTVELITIANAGHQWPGGEPKRIGAPPSNALNATTTIWQFFKAHPKP